MLVHTHSENEDDLNELAWWQKTLIYHVYLPSYMDSDNDGYGDIKGRTILIIFARNLKKSCIVDFGQKRI